MSRELVAAILWSILGLSFVLSLWAIAARSPRLLLVAASLSVAFGLATIFSIGLGILTIAVLQVACAILLSSRHRSDGESRL